MKSEQTSSCWQDLDKVDKGTQIFPPATHLFLDDNPPIYHWRLLLLWLCISKDWVPIHGTINSCQSDKILDKFLAEFGDWQQNQSGSCSYHYTFDQEQHQSSPTFFCPPSSLERHFIKKVITVCFGGLSSIWRENTHGGLYCSKSSIIMTLNNESKNRVVAKTKGAFLWVAY